MRTQFKLSALLGASIVLCLAGCTPQGRAEYEEAGTKAGMAAQETGEAIATDAAATGKAVGKMTDQARVAAAASETTIKVKNALLTADGLDAKGIDVDTVGRNVHLKGTVPNSENQARAGRIAELTVGSDYQVVNELKVG